MPTPAVPPAATLAPVPPAHVVVATGDTRLAQLYAAYPAAKAAADAATEALKAITDGIKAEMAAAAPDGCTDIELRSPDVPVAPMALKYVESWRIDAKKMKSENPLAYATYAKRSGSWRLAPVKGGGE